MSNTSEGERRTKAQEWLLLPDKAKSELNRLLPPDYCYALEWGHERVHKAAGLVGHYLEEALYKARKEYDKDYEEDDEVRQRHDHSEGIGFRQLWIELREYASRFEVGLGFGPNGARYLRWPTHGMDATTGDPLPPPPPEWPPHEDRWRNHIRWKLFAFVGTRLIDPPNEDWIDPIVPYPPLLFGQGLVPEPDLREQALRIARELTADTSPNRERYRLNRRTGKASIPMALCQRVSYILEQELRAKVSPGAVRDSLEKYGYKLPWDLQVRLKPYP
jgi:hypothetical protein